MKGFILRQCSLVGLLATGSVVVAAEQSPFEKQDYQPRQKTSDCRILEFNCSTCGHVIDPEMWTKDNRLITDIETCEQNRREQEKQQN